MYSTQSEESEPVRMFESTVVLIETRSGTVVHRDELFSGSHQRSEMAVLTFFLFDNY
jgi:hypothetical protein